MHTCVSLWNISLLSFLHALCPYFLCVVIYHFLNSLGQEHVLTVWLDSEAQIQDFPKVSPHSGQFCYHCPFVQVIQCVIEYCYYCDSRFRLLLNQLLCSNFGLKASCQSKVPQALGVVNGVVGGLAWQGASGSWWDDKCWKVVGAQHDVLAIFSAHCAWD